ncbi:MAG: HIT family protein [Nitrospirales bacterium]|nr:HIT family protein [Nitrospirales bacterium]
MFCIHERLKADTIEIGRLGLSHLLLMNDSSLPWLILVPERADVTEIFQLSLEDCHSLIEEIGLVSRIIQDLYSPNKINVGALGNLVPQLHIHVIGRYRTDRAWPGPIWGTGPVIPYADEEVKTVRMRFREALGG